MTRPQLWEDEDGDQWVFSADGEQSWLREVNGWDLAGYTRTGAEVAWGPLVAVDMPEGVTEFPDGAE